MVADVTCKSLFQQFLEIDKYGGRIIGIKEMGQLNVKAFETACAEKVRTTKVADVSSKLYSLWQQRITDVSWNPFNTITVEGNHQVCQLTVVGSFLASD